MFDREQLYTVFKICLLLRDMSTKAFADIYTGTSPQHVTMVAKGDKESVPVKNQIHNFIDDTLKEPRNQSFLKSMVNHGRQQETGTQPAGQPTNGDDYDW